MLPTLLRSLFFCCVFLLSRGELTAAVWQWSVPDGNARAYLWIPPDCERVREGPAEIEGDTLVFTAIPPRAKLPFAVTVVAWQYGRSNEPKLKTAAPVERTFFHRQKMTA